MLLFSNKDIIKSNIYLCIQKSKFDEFICIKFNSYEDANKHYYKYYNNLDYRSTLIPVCSYTPLFLHKYILHYKISKTLVKLYIVS
jgi:hypothetical protein